MTRRNYRKEYDRYHKVLRKKSEGHHVIKLEL